MVRTGVLDACLLTLLQTSFPDFFMHLYLLLLEEYVAPAFEHFVPDFGVEATAVATIKEKAIAPVSIFSNFVDSALLIVEGYA